MHRSDDLRMLRSTLFFALMAAGCSGSEPGEKTPPSDPVDTDVETIMETGTVPSTVKTGDTSTEETGSTTSTITPGGMFVVSSVFVACTTPGAPPVELVDCDAPETVVDSAGDDTCYVRCANEALHRTGTRDWSVAIDTCCSDPATMCPGANETCATQRVDGTDACECVSWCASDGDCASGEICVSPEVITTSNPWPQCVPAACETGADCDSGHCGITSFDDGCGRSVALSCRTNEDLCRFDEDCVALDTGSLPQDWSCYTRGGDYRCGFPDCDIGRPFSTSGGYRRAPAVSQSWSSKLAPSIPPDLAERAQLAADWTSIALAEHASIASFAAVLLELTALGAPAPLLRDTAGAMADEVRHAELSFALASAYAGESVGPGPMSMEGVAIRTDPVDVLRALISEACVGETISVAEGQRMLHGATDPVVRRVLVETVRDEMGHAALAWRTLHWLLSVHPELRGVAAEAFADARAEWAGHPALSAVVEPSREQLWGLLA